MASVVKFVNTKGSIRSTLLYVPISERSLVTPGIVTLFIVPCKLENQVSNSTTVLDFVQNSLVDSIHDRLLRGVKIGL